MKNRVERNIGFGDSWCNSFFNDSKNYASYTVLRSPLNLLVQDTILAISLLMFLLYARFYSQPALAGHGA